MVPLHTAIILPAWFSALTVPNSFSDDVELQMRYAIDLAWRNVNEKTGGPFAAVVLQEQLQDSERPWIPIAAGVNMVVPGSCSLLHAETIALMMAQMHCAKHYSLNQCRRRLLTTASPCIQCFGAIWWSGISELIVAARREDVEQIGFDEGPVPSDWKERLLRDAPHPVKVEADVLRAEAREVLQLYKKSDGAIYNAGNSQR